ncbi:response regulator transcription factor [Eisenbergiella sp.]
MMKKKNREKKNMIQVLIVEDEKIFREYVCKLIDWSKLGMELAGEARNGKEALSLMEGKKIGIVLVDINMPVMNGLEYCERARALYPKVKLIILTGYDEFDYARKAIKLGISDYVLKPFDCQELLQSLVKAKREISEDENLERQEQVQYANYLISDAYIFEEQKYKEFCDRVRASFYRIVVIEKDYFDPLWEEKGEKRLWKDTVINMVEESCVEVRLCFANQDGKVVLLLCFEKEDTANAYSLEVLQKICRLLRQKMKFSVTCAVGDYFSDLRQMKEHYSKLERLLDRKLALGCGGVLEQQKIGRNEEKFDYPMLKTEEFRKALQKGDKEALEELFIQLEQETADKKLRPDILLMFYTQLVGICLSVLVERKLEIGMIFGQDFVPFTEVEKRLATGDALDYVSGLYEKSLNQIINANYSRTSILVKEAQKYIEQHYSDCELSVEVIAANLYINSSYLRAAFHKELGIPVSQYLFSVRMERAADLIRQGNGLLGDVSLKIGIRDGTYFSKCFKKKYGITPSEYANIVRQK